MKSDDYTDLMAHLDRLQLQADATSAAIAHLRERINSLHLREALPEATKREHQEARS